MRIYYNHIPKTGGLSLGKLFEHDSKLRFARINTTCNENDLERVANMFADGDCIVQGHSYEPNINCNFLNTVKFWSFIYDNADFKFSVLRHPFDRAISYIKYSGFRNKNVTTLNPNYFYKHLPWTLSSPESDHNLANVMRDHHYFINEINFRIFKEILPEAFYLNYPFSENLATCINDYTIHLGDRSDKNSLTPNSLRPNEDKFQFDLYCKNYLDTSFLFENVFKIKKYMLFALEDISYLNNWLLKIGAIKGNYSFPHENKSKLDMQDQCTQKDLQENKTIKCSLSHEYPESLNLWKMAIMRRAIY